MKKANYLPFEDLVKPLPDGTIPAVEVAKMAYNSDLIKWNEPKYVPHGWLGILKNEVPHYVDIMQKLSDYAEYCRILHNFDVQAGGDFGMYDISNQVKIHNYLREVGFNVDGVEV